MAFQDVIIGWQGKDYTIPRNRVMRAIAIIEEHFTLQQLSEFSDPSKMRFTRLSFCAAEVLAYAGVPGTTDELAEQVYEAMIGGDADVMETIQELLLIAVPQDKLKEAEAKVASGKSPGKSRSATRKRKSSPRSTRQSSAKA